MGGTCGSGVLASACDVLEISVVRGVGGVYDMCMCLARGWVGGDRIGFGLYQFWRNMGKVGYVSVFRWCGWCHSLSLHINIERYGGVGGEWVGGLGQGLGGWGGVMSVCVVSLDSLCRWQVQVSVYCARRIPAHLRCTQCLILLHVIDIANPDLLACGSRIWISLDIAHFYEEHCQPSSGSAWPAGPKNGNISSVLFNIYTNG